MNQEEAKQLFQQRLGRYQAAVRMEPLDRMPVAAGSNYFAEVYSGSDNQRIIYDQEAWFQAEKKFCEDFPQVDVLRNNRIYAPLYDAINLRTYRLPGRDLEANTQFQFIEKEYMQADEYDRLIENPTLYMLEVFLPRVVGEFESPGSPRALMAALKGGMAAVHMAEAMKNRSIRLQTECGMPQPMTGAFVAPFDVIADCMRGLTGAMMDMFRQPGKVKAACDAVADDMVNFALATADPLRRYPIFVPTHKPMFLSPDQFQEFYWPSFKKVLDKVREAGYAVRAYLEGDWSKHWKAMLELPKGTVVCDIDTQGDIYQALDEIGHHQCLTGGIPESLLILGTPKEIREKVKELCQAVGKDKRLLINGGCNIPYDTKPENYRALVEAIVEFGQYDSSLSPAPRQGGLLEVSGERPRPKVFTSWEQRQEEWGGVKGDEDLIKEPWNRLEAMAYQWVWQWIM
jgi:uroporphyrinogen-III decarboxylase